MYRLMEIVIVSAKRAPAILILAITASLCGCASSGLPAPPRGARPHVVYGRPNAVLDRTGWVLGIPSKLALWDKRADNHAVSPQTVHEVGSYLQSRGAQDVLVRVNQYLSLIHI